MYKNQLQELAQRSCFNLPSYACIREGPDHAPRFRASVNFNGEVFESPGYSSTLRQAEHAAAEAALNALSTRGSKSLTARVLDETGVYKNLLQETAHKAGLNLPVYTTVRSGPGHVPVFTCTVELAGLEFIGEPARTKKQAEKNAAIAAWSALKKKPNLVLKTDVESHEEQDQEIVKRVLSKLRPRGGDQWQSRRRTVRGKYQQKQSDSRSRSRSRSSFVDLLPPPPPRTTSKILPLTSSSSSTYKTNQVVLQCPNQSHGSALENPKYSYREEGADRLGCTKQEEETHFKSLLFGQFPSSTPSKEPSFGSAHMRLAAIHTAPAVHIRTVIPVCSAPPPSKSTLPPPLTTSFSMPKTAEQDPQHEQEEEFSSSSSSTKLCSKLNKLQL